MEIRLASMKKEFVEDFIHGMEELGIKVCGEPFEISGNWCVMYRPIGKKQKEKCERYIEYRCINGLM